MTGAISQMQMLYVPEEDRILFRVNTTSNHQFRFWLTRRYTILLLRVLKEHVESDPDVSMQGTPEAKEAVKSFKQEKAIQSANFKENFREKANELPLGQDIPVAFKLTYNIKEGNLNVGLQPKEGQGINMAINREINSSLTQLLLGAAKKGEWSLEGVAQPAAVQENIVIN
jgi:hypothetical protein